MIKGLKVLLALIVAVSFVALAGCKSDEEKLISYMEEMGEIVEENKDDCDAMGKALTSFAEDNGEDMKKIMDKLKDQGEEEQKAAEEKYGDRMKDVMKKMMGIAECADNEGVEKAREALPF